MKKRVIFLFIFIMISTLLMMSACQDNNNSVVENDEKEIKNYDLQGIDFIFACEWITEYYPEEGFSDAGDNIGHDLLKSTRSSMLTFVLKAKHFQILRKLPETLLRVVLIWFPIF